MTRSIRIVVLGALLTLAGCAVFTGPDEAARLPTVSQAAGTDAAALPARDAGESQDKLAVAGPVVAPPAGESCAVPAGWVPYQLQLNETVYSVALRATVSAEDLLRANCTASPAAIRAGSWLYAPPEVAASAPQTVLPLGISALVVNPAEAAAGEPVTLAWKAQGPVVRVRAGWLAGEQFIEAATGLPVVGAWQMALPVEACGSVTLVVRASDGLHEVAAQTTVRVRCDEGWFFDPAPAECPAPPLVTTLIEQRFERGVMIYAPALGTHYALVNGRASQRLPDDYALELAAASGVILSAGLTEPTGAIGAAWRSEAALRVALGYATGEATRYMGLMQRAPGAAHETLYLSAGGGGVYRFVEGGAWGMVAAP